jgi:L-threonylcarbamoyladenylate synthase
MRLIAVSPEAVDEALRVLATGGVVAHATETCYGLACDLRNPAAVARLFAIKRRPADQPVSALFASLEDAKRYVEWNDRAQALASDNLPGPLTLILPLRKDAPPLCPTPIPSPIPTLGIRISSHPLAAELAARFGHPLSTTSANLHGEPNPYSATEIERLFRGHDLQPDLILDSGGLPPTPPSTIIDLSRTGSGQTRRQGGLSL